MDKIWAVEPSFLVEYLETTLNIGNDLKKLSENPSGFFGDISSQEKEIFSISGDTAIINIKGILSQEGPSFIDRFFGFDGTGYQEILKAVEDIQNKEDVKNVRLVMDTPGGEVSGLDKVFQAISGLSKSKNVVAESHGLIASAGYWIASAANQIIATSPADEIGSIGVVVVAIDFSKAREERGIKVVVIRSENAPKKQPDVSTEKGKNVLQDRVDSLERVFIGRISEGRGIPVETIEKDFARGSVLIAEDPDKTKDDALSVGMIDSVQSIVSPALAPKNKNVKSISQMEDSFMTLDELMAKHPELKIELDSRDKGNIAKGIQQEKEVAKERIEKCKPYLASEEYPKAIKSLAMDVISGKSEFSALETSVTVLDALAEQKKSNAASKETDGQAETQSGAQDGGTASDNGECNSNEEFEALEKTINKQ